MERYGFDQFTELYDGDATVANVEQGLTWLFEDVGPDDRLVFFYSGHGYQQPKGENLEECLVLGDMKFLFDDRLRGAEETEADRSGLVSMRRTPSKSGSPHWHAWSSRPRSTRCPAS